MSFVNTIVSEENAQFEVFGHYKIWWNSIGIWSTYYYTLTLVRKAVKDYIADGFHDETVHFIWASYEAGDRCHGKTGYRAEIIHIFYKVMIEHGIDKPFMITFLGRYRSNCETKEDCVAAYNSQYRGSIGDNLENFIIDLNNNKYGFQNAGLDSKDAHDCFHYAMLTRQEEKEIKNPVSDFLATFESMNPDVPKTEMAKSDSKHKYVRSDCVRATYII